MSPHPKRAKVFRFFFSKKNCFLFFLPATVLLPGQAIAQTGPAAEQITVVATSPLLGAGIDRDRVPAATSVLDSAAIARNGSADLLGALAEQTPGLSIASASGNPFQPSIFLNGFEASPLQGTSQGIAVYVDGVRFNEPFGDTVDWDLVPDIAISRLDVAGSNPVFGLNALGGSIDVRLRDGFSYAGAEATLSGGSFGRVQGQAQYGRQFGETAVYVAGSVTHEDGWRDQQGSDIQDLVADLGWKRDALALHLGLDAANSVLNGPGTSPVQLLAADPAAQFTAPNLIANRFLRGTASASLQLSDSLSMQALGYSSYFLQRVVNGNPANDGPCGDGSGLLCSAPGTPSTTRGGAAVPDFLSGGFAAGGPYAELDDQTTNTFGYGASLQATETAELFGHANHLVAGLSFDGAQTAFSATALLGGLSPSRAFVGPGVVIDEPGTNVPVRVAVANGYGGAFVADTLDLLPHLALTASARLNEAAVDLSDQGGGRLSGRHRYERLNPAAGATYAATNWLVFYAGYAEANRAPTPAELSCAGPADACSLANFFVGDPDLRQVVAHTVEAGVRGHWALAADGRAGYALGVFRTGSTDDIAFVNSVTLGRAFFANIGQTRRQGVTAHLDAAFGIVRASADYSYTEAVFGSGFVEAAGQNPAALPNGTLAIRPGDRLPGIPADIFKGSLDVDPTPTLHVGASLVWQSGQYLFGDDANVTPKLPGYAMLGYRISYQVTPQIQLFGNIANATNRRFYTYGTFSPTAAVFLSQAPGAVNPRSYSPAAPIGGFAGMRVTF